MAVYCDTNKHTYTNTLLIKFILIKYVIICLDIQIQNKFAKWMDRHTMRDRFLLHPVFAVFGKYNNKNILLLCNMIIIMLKS